MPTCKSCGDEADELVTVKVAGKTKKLCESCADEVREQGEVAEASEAVVQNMMGFKGRAEPSSVIRSFMASSVEFAVVHPLTC
jgi:ribosome-binding protein aMBF1 (putative translation factor)